MFKITYITHSSVLIETEDAKVITDPWFRGSAYLNHWHVFPKPVDTSYANDVTHIVISHGHEDHCHLPTLEQMNKNAIVYLPYTWLDGTKTTIRNLGFRHIHEMDSYRTVAIGKHLKLTFIVNGLDSVLVIEHKGKVYINLNDAFNAMHKEFVKLFAQKVRLRWPVIHYLMCGVGGAGYFPNTIHSTTKNDWETGVQREQFLMHLFCEFVASFKPEKVIPFLPGFALLQKDKLWINRIRQPRVLIDAMYKEMNTGHEVDFLHFYPGDYMLNEEWCKESPYYNQVKHDDWSLFAEEQYALEIALGADVLHSQKEGSLPWISDQLNVLFPISSKGIPQPLLQQLNFMISLSDVPDGYIHCSYANGQIKANPAAKVVKEANLLIRTNSRNLLYSINELWGGDVFFIGYGADIDVLNPACLDDNLDILSLRVLSVFPRAKQYIRKHPLRAVRYFYHNRIQVILALKQKFVYRNKVNKLPFNERSHWIRQSKCETCRVCNVPLLDSKLAQQLV